MDVYIFGAGASAAEGLPSTDQFFASAYELLGAGADRRVHGVWQFLTRVFGRPVSGPDCFALLPGVDEVISLVDWALHVNQGLGPEYDLPRLYQVRRDLEHLVCATLDAALDTRSVAAAAAEGPHLRFAKALAQRGRPEEVGLLSLNYDTLLDDALTAAGMTIDYGLDGDHPEPATRAGAQFLGKLHGSLNWSQCPACGWITTATRQGRRLLPRMETLTCAGCGNGRLDGLIISPTWRKTYHASRLQRVWDRALTLLRQADRLIFVGYSMPPADVAIYQLILRGLLAGGRQGNVAVQVINRSPGGAPAAQQRIHEETVRHRFSQLFGPYIRFDFTGFWGQLSAAEEK